MAETTFTCPDVHVEACKKAPECPPPPPPPPPEVRTEYVGSMPHWCAHSVCEGGEIASAVFTGTIILAIAIAAACLITYFRNELRDHGLDSKKKAFELAKLQKAAAREEAAANLQLEQQRRDMIYQDKVRTEQLSRAAARAHFDPLGLQSDDLPPPKRET